MGFHKNRNVQSAKRLDMTEYILTRRLHSIYWPPWADAIAKDRRIQRSRPLAEFGTIRGRIYDIRRVRFFMDEILADRPIDPIFVDNEVTPMRWGGPIYWGMPFIDDGHHRFIAHVLLGCDWIPASLGGFGGHHEWLRGERNDFVPPGVFAH